MVVLFTPNCTSNLSLNEVHRLLKLQEKFDGSFTDYLNLEPLIEFEQQDLSRIRNDFQRYLKAGKSSEGMHYSSLGKL